MFQNIAQVKKTNLDSIELKKKDFRREALKKRNSLSEADRKMWSEEIGRKLTELMKTKEEDCVPVRSVGSVRSVGTAGSVRSVGTAGSVESVRSKDSSRIICVLLYASYGFEVDTFELMKECWKEKQEVYLPKVTDSASKKMEFFRVSAMEDLTEGFKGIPEPKHINEENKYISDDETLSIIIVPGCAFDEVGHRMGYGGGFYDRYLEKHHELIKVGICFEEQLWKEIPFDEHDIRMDYIVTERKILDGFRF